MQTRNTVKFGDDNIILETGGKYTLHMVTWHRMKHNHFTRGYSQIEWQTLNVIIIMYKE